MIPRTSAPTSLLGLAKIEFGARPGIARFIGEKYPAEQRGWVAAELR